MLVELSKDELERIIGWAELVESEWGEFESNEEDLEDLALLTKLKIINGD